MTNQTTAPKNSMIELLPNGRVSVDVLHKFLEIEKPFYSWFPKLTKDFGFEIDVDYWSTPRGIELTSDCAKEICMIERTPKAREIKKTIMKVIEKHYSEEWITLDEAKLRGEEQNRKNRLQQN